MPSITVTLKDGTVQEFLHKGRAGGSYTKQLILRDGFVIIEDEWGVRTVFPASEVAKVEETPTR